MSISQSFSPLSRLQSTLASEVSSGAISSSDQSALSSALSDIDSALKSQAPQAGSSPSSGTPPSRDAIKSKIDSLIADEVKSGKLTSAQADELKQVFAKAFQGHHQGGGEGGPGGPGGPGGGGGANSTSTDPADANKDGVVTAAEQAAYDAAHSTQADATSSSASSSSDTSGSDTSKVLSDFLKMIQESQSNASSYGANGDSADSRIQSLVVNYQA
jgi:hypothetical protein